MLVPNETRFNMQFLILSTKMSVVTLSVSPKTEKNVVHAARFKLLCKYVGTKMSQKLNWIKLHIFSIVCSCRIRKIHFSITRTIRHRHCHWKKKIENEFLLVDNVICTNEAPLCVHDRVFIPPKRKKICFPLNLTNRHPLINKRRCSRQIYLVLKFRILNAYVEIGPEWRTIISANRERERKNHLAEHRTGKWGFVESVFSFTRMEYLSATANSFSEKRVRISWIDANGFWESQVHNLMYIISATCAFQFGPVNMNLQLVE